MFPRKTRGRMRPPMSWLTPSVPSWLLPGLLSLDASSLELLKGLCGIFVQVLGIGELLFLGQDGALGISQLVGGRILPLVLLGNIRVCLLLEVLKCSLAVIIILLRLSVGALEVREDNFEDAH